MYTTVSSSVNAGDSSFQAPAIGRSDIALLLSPSRVTSWQRRRMKITQMHIHRLESAKKVLLVG
jgi:hypothetical protein